MIRRSRTYDFSSLQTVQNGGARLSPELRDRIRKTLRCQYQEVYGTAEGLLNLSPLDADDETILTSSGAADVRGRRDQGARRERSSKSPTASAANW